MQRFEVLYGPLHDELKQCVLSSKNPIEVLTDPALKDAALTGIVEVFTTRAAIPVALATALIALGWVVALPPFDFKIYGTFWQTVFHVNQDPISFSFLGAYFFSLQMLFYRYLREDLRGMA
jgi:hypothetical protein